MREHTPNRTRTHYSTNGGGFPPNMVSDRSDAWYYVCAPYISQVKDILRHLALVATGAAMMTETAVDIKVEYACSEIQENNAYGDLTYKNLEDVGWYIEYTEEELAFAQAIVDTLDPNLVKVQKQSSMVGGDDTISNLWYFDCGKVEVETPKDQIPCRYLLC